MNQDLPPSETWRPVVSKKGVSKKGVSKKLESDPDVTPYRILKRIGSGGMGEVFVADDHRLGRRVAIKRIRPDRELDEVVRARLRREARFVAGLSHPAIVQVYDVLERDAAFYVVMEWIDGENLRQRLKREGPLPVETVIDLARQLAGGLAEAHRRGIVHRDFKAENVLVDKEGRAKITDFGIAKQLPTNIDEETEEAEETLTQDEAVLGTYRAMSPEQALGNPVDPRSDLFSFGVLLYEILTGESPFLGASSLGTLRRVVEHTPPRVESVRPDTPPALARLIRQLLEKDRDLRPRGAGEVEHTLASLDSRDITRSTEAALRPIVPWWRAPAMTVVVAVLMLAVALIVQHRPSPTASIAPIYVATMNPEMRPKSDTSVREGELEIFAEAVRSAVIRGLVGLEGVSTKDPALVDGSEGKDALEIARRVAADEIVTSSILYRPDRAWITLHRLRGADGTVLWTGSLEVPSDDLVLTMRTISGQVRWAYPNLEVRPDLPGLDVQPDDLRRFLALHRRHYRRDDPSGDAILKELEEIRESSPNFYDADLLTAQVAIYHFYDARDARYLDLARQAIERAEAKAPDDPRTLRQRFELERRTGHSEAAEAALQRLTELLPGDVFILDLRARLLLSQGRAKEALALMSEAVQLRPSLERLIDLSRLELDQGQIDDARGHLRAALDRSPDFFEALSLLAQLELGSGDPATAVELYRRLVHRMPGISEISNLGVAHMLLGEYAQAVAQFKRAFEAEPRNPFFALNLADAVLLSGDTATATELYRGVVERVRADPAADEAQFQTVEAQALAHLGREREAVAALLQALSKSPDSASVAYEASLVYALIGERTSALVHAEAALKGGFDRRWFAFPWFDELRREPGFKELENATTQAAPQASHR